MAVKNCFIRGSVVRYVTLPSEHVDTQLLEDATRRGTFRTLDISPLHVFLAYYNARGSLLTRVWFAEAATQVKK